MTSSNIISSVIRDSGVDDVEACLKWALGDFYGYVAIMEYPKVWNKRHGDIFLMTYSDLIEDSLRKMALAYREKGTPDNGQQAL